MSLPGPAMVALKWRAVVFAVVTTAVLAAFYLWEASPHPGSNIYPDPDFLGSTWYGPVLLLLIPTSLAWCCLGLVRRHARVLGLILALLVFAVCVQLIIASIELTRPWALPWMPSGGPVR